MDIFYFYALRSSWGLTLTIESNHSNSNDMLSLVRKIENFGPYFEAMQQDTGKLAAQVRECRGLSDRLSGMVVVFFVFLKLVSL